MAENLAAHVARVDAHAADPEFIERTDNLEPSFWWGAGVIIEDWNSPEDAAYDFDGADCA